MTADAELLQADVAARTRALDIGQSFIVQAPAGSGKTELLIQRYLRLLSSVDAPEEVLAITFTRKAALEMQMRVLVALQNAVDGVAVESDHEQRTRELASAALERDDLKGWQLVSSPGRMRIETIDAFGAGLGPIATHHFRAGWISRNDRRCGRSRTNIAWPRLQRSTTWQATMLPRTR